MSHDEFLGYVIVDVTDYLGLEEPKTTTVALLDDPLENKWETLVIATHVEVELTQSGNTEWRRRLVNVASS